MSQPRFHIELSHIAKRYDFQWIFKDVNLSLATDQLIAICGRNGSGKSTLMRIICGIESPNQGQRIYFSEETNISPDHIYQYVSFCAPYINVPDHLKLKELLDFHAHFKSMRISSEQILEDIVLTRHREKPFHLLSSGQKQKVKLALAIYSDSPILLLDEPSTNLDDNNYQWFTDTLITNKSDRLICIATNDKRDMEICNASYLLGSGD